MQLYLGLALGTHCDDRFTSVFKAGLSPYVDSIRDHGETTTFFDELGRLAFTGLASMAREQLEYNVDDVD